jgi:hypothetical protein
MILKEPNKVRKISVRLTESEYQEIQKACKNHDCKMTDIIRSAVRKLITRLGKT